MKQNTAGVIGLALRAGALSAGTNNVLEAIRGRKAHLVLISCNASANTKKSLSDKAAFYSVRTADLDIEAAELGKLLGKGETAAVAFTNANFVKAYEKSISNTDTANQERGM